MPTPTNRDILKFYFSHAWTYKWFVLGLLIWLPILQVLHNVIPSVLSANILDKLAEGNFTDGNIWEDFGAQLVAFALLTLFTGTLGWRIAIYLVWTLENNVLRDIHNKMFAKLASLDMDFHNNSFGGSLVSKTNKLVSSYVRIADTFVFDIIGLIVVLISSGVILWPKAPQFVIGLYLFTIFFIIISILLTKKIRILSSVEAEKQNDSTGSLADMVTNVLAVKSFSSDYLEIMRHGKKTSAVKDASDNIKWAQLHRENIFSFTTISLTAMAMVLAVLAVADYGASVGTVFLILTLTNQITVRLWDFSQRTLRNLNRALGDAQEGVKIIQKIESVRDTANPSHMLLESGTVSFNNVGFSHESEKLFNKFTLKIKSGEKLGLVGHSGSGKTTLTRLLLRLIDIDEGEILIDGTDIRSVKQNDLRANISYVPQEPLLFHRTLRENIAYGKPDASDTEIISAAKKAHAHEFIKELPKGYETLVGERGVKLSGGQKQRVAIARAMIKQAPILVLDEATSALDSESEQLIQDALWKLMEGRTTIVIAHRLSTINNMDRIVVLDKGKIVEEGTHETLRKKKKGLYARLWAHQSGGFITE